MELTSKFVSFYDLMRRRNLTAGQLTTAVEQYGVYGWDRYGRFKKSNQKEKGDEIQANALKALEDWWSHERSWWDSLDHNDPEGPGSGPLDFFDDSPEFPLYKFGWPEDGLPEFKPADPGPITRPLHKRSQNALLAIIGALLETCKKPRARPISEAQLIEALVSSYGSVDGISVSNLQNRFAEAKRTLGSLVEINPP